MSNITTILDACSIINMICIDDESEFLIKKLKHLDIHICEKVYREVRSNAFKIPEERERIELAISKFLSYLVPSANISNEMGNDFEDEVKYLSEYKKENGEFYSSLLGLYITQTQPTKLCFVTDDYVAKKDFNFFYGLHQIGPINDTADLLLLLYRLDDNFSKNELIRLLSNLYSQYASEVVELTSKLKSYTVPKRLLKDKKFKSTLRKLIFSLESFSFIGINDARLHFNTNRKGLCRGIINILEQHAEVFELEATSKQYLTKIRELIKHLREKEVYKFIA